MPEIDDNLPPTRTAYDIDAIVADRLSEALKAL